MSLVLSNSRARFNERFADAFTHSPAALVYQTAFPALFYFVTAMAYGRALACVDLLLGFSSLPIFELPPSLHKLTQHLTARSKGEKIALEVKPTAAARPVKV